MAIRSGMMIGTLFLAFLCSISTANADEKRIARLRWENDTFQRQLFGIGEYTDRHYTQGAWLDYIHSDNEVNSPKQNDPSNQPGNFFFSRSVMNWIPNLGLRSVERTTGGITFGQQMYTPEFIGLGELGSFPGVSPTADDLQINDRPYAGYLHIGPRFERRGLSWLPFLNPVPTRDDLSLELGVVGPGSAAGDTQSIWHEAFDGVTPEGWQHQLDNEPVIQLRGGRAWLWSSQNDSDGFGIDLIPQARFDLGNVSIRGTAGFEARLGIGLPRDFSIPNHHRATPQTLPFAAYVFGGIEGSVVGRNLFLDGNTFSDSHSVEKNTLIGQARFGLGMFLVEQTVEMKAAWTGRTREFEKQKESDSFITLTMGVFF